MYHIGNHKRSAASAELIYQGLLACAKKKPFDQITISDLQRASSVARTTFYRNFDNISDVLYWKCDSSFSEALNCCTSEPFPNELEFALYYFQYWMNHSDILELLLQINRQDIIYACHIKNAELLQKRYGSIPGLSKSASRYFIPIRTGFTISVLTAWLKGGKAESPKEIVKILQEQLKIISGHCF